MAQPFQVQQASPHYPDQFYNILFHPLTETHTTQQRLASVVSIIVLTILTGPVFWALFLWRQQVDSLRDAVSTLQVPNPINQKASLIFKEASQEKAQKFHYTGERKPIPPRLLQALNVVHLHGDVASNHCFLLKEAAHYIDTPEGNRAFQILCEQILKIIGETERGYFSALIAPNSFDQFFELLYLNRCGMEIDSLATEEMNETVGVFFQHAVREHSCAFLYQKVQDDNALTPEDRSVLLDAINNRNASVYKEGMIRFLEFKMAVLLTTRSMVDYFLIKELKEKIEGASGDIFVETASILRTEELYEELVRFMQDNRDQLKMVFVAKRVHKYIGRHLSKEGFADLNHNLSIRKAQLRGFFTREFRQLNDQFKTRHQMCGCHVDHVNRGRLSDFFEQSPILRVVPAHETLKPDAKDMEENPGNYPLKGRSILLISACMGGGHAAPSQAAERLLASKGAHVYYADGPEHIMLEIDQLYAITQRFGWPQTIGGFIDLANKHGWYFLLRGIDWLFSGKLSEAFLEAETALIIRALLERGVDMVVPFYQRNGGVIARAAEDVGIPSLVVATDLWTYIPDQEAFRSPDYNFNYFKFGINAQYNKLMQSSCFMNGEKPIYAENQVKEIGFSVHEAFFSDKDESAIRQKYHVASDAKVVVIMSGGNGVSHNYPEMIKEHFGAENPKTHVFVLCGNNNSELNRHCHELGGGRPRQNISHQGGNLVFTVLPRIGSPDVADLMHLTKAGGCVVSQKGGGGTMNEVIVTGTRAVVCTGNTPWEWEKENALYWCTEQGMGRTFEKDDDMWEALQQVLAEDVPEEIPLRELVQQSQGKMVSVVQHMLEEADADNNLRARHAHVLLTE